MKVSLLTGLLALASGACSAPLLDTGAVRALETRQFDSLLNAPIAGALDSVTSAINDFDAKVRQIHSSDINGLLALQTAASNIGTTLSNAETTIKNAPDPSLIELLQIELSSDSLQKALDKLADDLIAIKPYVVQAGVTDVVKNQVVAQRDAADGLVDALSAKIPALFKPLADDAKNKADATLDRVIAAYSTNSTSSSGGSGDSSGDSGADNSGGDSSGGDYSGSDNGGSYNTGENTGYYNSGDGDDVTYEDGSNYGNAGYDNSQGRHSN